MRFAMCGIRGGWRRPRSFMRLAPCHTVGRHQSAMTPVSTSTLSISLISRLLDRKSLVDQVALLVLIHFILLLALFCKHLILVLKFILQNFSEKITSSPKPVII